MSAMKTPATPSRHPVRGVRFAVVAASAAVLLASAVTARANPLTVGNVYTFSTGSTAGNPTGSWTSGDKTFTYLSSTGFLMTSPGGVESIDITENNFNNNHSFLLSNLQTFAPGTYTLGYQLQITPGSPYVLSTAALDSTHLSNNVDIWKDVFSSFLLFETGTTPGSGDVSSLYSVNGFPTGDSSLDGLTHVWVRDTLQIGPTGQLASLDNIYTQMLVPEIDATSFAGAFPILVGGLALLERRRRRGTDRGCPADC